MQTWVIQYINLLAGAKTSRHSVSDAPCLMHAFWQQHPFQEAAIHDMFLVESQ